MANQKNADPALVQKKLAVLNPQLKALEEQRAACEDPRKQKLLEKKIEKVHDKIRQAKTGERFSRQTKRDFVAYSFIAPNFIGFAIFTLGPVIFAFVLAFLNWDGNNPISFAGLENFVKMFGNKRFLASLRNTVVYCLATVPLTLIAALGLAVILNQKVRGRNFFRTVSFFPYVASLVAVAAVWNCCSPRPRAAR